MCAKVFISCGQRRNTEEVEIARAISRRLRRRGFDTYVATEEQTLRGVKDNIFSQLSSSEYFLFIDFKRERIARTAEFRGSPFSHQELAIASLLDLPLIAFQEEGVRREDGLMRFLQTNSYLFNSRQTLVELVMRRVTQRRWNPNWRNALIFERNTNQFTDATAPNGVVGRYFHIKVRNLNPYKQAVNCFGYVSSIENLATHQVISLSGRSVELKWAGYVFPNVVILSSSHRTLDGLVILHTDPTHPRFSTFSDSTEFFTVIPGIGDYIIKYTVCSENFQVIDSLFFLHVDNSIDDSIFEILD